MSNHWVWFMLGVSVSQMVWVTIQCFWLGRTSCVQCEKRYRPRKSSSQLKFTFCSLNCQYQDNFDMLKAIGYPEAEITSYLSKRKEFAKLPEEWAKT